MDCNSEEGRKKLEDGITYIDCNRKHAKKNYVISGIILIRTSYSDKWVISSEKKKLSEPVKKEK